MTGVPRGISIGFWTIRVSFYVSSVFVAGQGDGEERIPELVVYESQVIAEVKKGAQTEI